MNLFFAGYWIFHCHIEFHVEVGMALIFKIGEHSDMPPTPEHFPKCGNYLPENHAVIPCNDNFILSTIKRLLPHVFNRECVSTNSVAVTLISSSNLMLLTVVTTALSIFIR